jgi:hypothetical protein
MLNSKKLLFIGIISILSISACNENKPSYKPKLADDAPTRSVAPGVIKVNSLQSENKKAIKQDCELCEIDNNKPKKVIKRVE